MFERCCIFTSLILACELQDVRWAAQRKTKVDSQVYMRPCGSVCEECFLVARDLDVEPEDLRKAVSNDPDLNSKYQTCLATRRAPDKPKQFQTHDSSYELSSVSLEMARGVV